MRTDKALKYFKLTQYFAELFSKDPSTKVGVLFLDPVSYDILSQGYNGMARGVDETIASRWERPIKYLYVEHAERNGMYNAIRKGISLAGAIALITLFPCADCARGLIQVGIETIVCPKPPPELVERWGTSFEVAQAMLAEAGVQIQYVEDLQDEQDLMVLSNTLDESPKA